MEFNLSEKINGENKDGFGHLWTEDVKEFIRLLKEDVNKIQNSLRMSYNAQIQIHNAIDKLAGDKLNGN
mgnify:CR=1 FL=1